MYAFLLSLGAAITAAGFALVASGISLQDRAFDASVATPGVIAIIGGCVLIGLAFVVRALLRVERALTSRAAERPTLPGEMSARSTDHAGEPRIAFPPKPKAAAAASTEREYSSQYTPANRTESAPVMDAGDFSLVPNQPTRLGEAQSVSQGGLSKGKLNDALHSMTAPRPVRELSRRPQPTNSNRGTLWPNAAPSSAEAQRPSAAQPGAPAAASQSGQAPTERAPVAAAGPSQTPAAVSILKSGVVEGIAYTLFSDGSIEAQLPAGNLRFNSIAELRSHIEQNG